MSLENIAALKVAEVAAEDCVLFLWATAPKLPEALHVMGAWGFQYRTSAVWDKCKIGMGYWFRGQHELLLLGTRGSPDAPEGFESVIQEPRRGHSRKPVAAYELIERAYPQASRLELFARQLRPGWMAWGDEIQQR